MKRYSASELRAHISRALDEVERGEPVVVERHGRRFRIVAEPRAPRREAPPAPFFEADEVLLEAGWTWAWSGARKSLRLRVGKRT